jgi:hypothetical protein
MNNLTPLQHCAQQLREEFARAEKEKQRMQLDKLESEARDLVNKFANSFSSLYSLLIGSNIEVHADASKANPVVVLTYRDNQAFISLESTNGKINSWRLLEKAYNATLPNKSFGMAADREDEHRLIIAIEEVLFTARPKEQVMHSFQPNNPVYDSLQSEEAYGS